MDEKVLFLLEQIIVRQNAIIDMMSSFMNVYANNNNVATEDVESGISDGRR